MLRRAKRTSSRLGSGLASIRPLALMTIPGVQKPHWTAPQWVKA